MAASVRTGGLLEGRGGQEGVGRQRCLRDTHEQVGVAVASAVLASPAAMRASMASLASSNSRRPRWSRRAGSCRRVLDADLAHHLAHDDLDVLIVDVNALLTVGLLNFLNEVVVDGGRAADAQDVVRVDSAPSVSWCPSMTSPSFSGYRRRTGW